MTSDRVFRIAALLLLTLLPAGRVLAQVPGSDCAAGAAEAREAWDAFREGKVTGEEVHDMARDMRLCESASMEDRLWGYRIERYFVLQRVPRVGYHELFAYSMQHLDPYASDEARLVDRELYADNLVLEGRYPEASVYFEQALSFAHAVSDLRKASLLLEMVTFYHTVGDHSEAMRLVNRAVEVGERAGGYILGWGLAWQVFLESIFRSAQVPPDVHERNLARIRRAIVLAESDHDADYALRQRVLVFSFSHKAGLLRRLGRLDEAWSAAERAVELARSYGQPRVLAQQLRLAAQIARLKGSPEDEVVMLREALELPMDDAIKEHLQRALAWAHLRNGELGAAEVAFRDVIETAERRRAEFGATDWATLALAWTEGYTREYAALRLARGDARGAFAWLDVGRGRYLRDMRGVGALQSATDDERQALDEIQAQLRTVRDSIRMADGDHPVELAARASRLQAEVSQHIVFEAVEPEPDLDRLQEALRGDNRYLVSYLIRPDSAHALVVSADRFEAVRLPAGGSAIAEAIAALSIPVTLDGLSDWGSSPVIDPEPLHLLYRYLFQPIESIVPEGVRVTIVMDPAIEQVPFGILLTEAAAPHQYHAWPYLLVRNAFSYELSAGLLLDYRPAPRGRFPLVAFGRSTFARDEAAQLGVDDLPTLRHVPSELASVRRAVRGGIARLDLKARESALYPLLSDAEVVHLASHAFVAGENPLNSAIILAPDDRRDGPDGDGVLYLYELIGHRLDASLVVLSGCSTARGSIRPGEGAIGLHYGFRAAGAHASLATAWPVDDEAMSTLMARFYHYLARGHPKDIALQSAQQDYLAAADRSAANPLLWGALVLAGDPAPVPWGDRRSPWAWVLLGAALIGAAVAGGRIVAR